MAIIRQFYGFVHAIYNSHQLLVSPNGLVESQEMVSLDDIELINAAGTPAAPHRFKIRVKDGRENTLPWKLWLGNEERAAPQSRVVNLTEPVARGAAERHGNAGREGDLLQDDSLVQEILFKMRVAPEEKVTPERIDKAYDKGHITADERFALQSHFEKL